MAMVLSPYNWSYTLRIAGGHCSKWFEEPFQSGVWALALGRLPSLRLYLKVSLRGSM